MKTNININTIEKYAIIDEKGKVIEKFRLKYTAIIRLSELKKEQNYLFGLKIKLVEEKD